MNSPPADQEVPQDNYEVLLTPRIRRIRDSAYLNQTKKKKRSLDYLIS
jgi:hypothetical protein